MEAGLLAVLLQHTAFPLLMAVVLRPRTGLSFVPLLYFKYNLPLPPLPFLSKLIYRWAFSECHSLLNQVIGTHGQVQGRQIVGVVPVGVSLRAEPLHSGLPLRCMLGVVPVGVNLRALQLCSNLRYVICYRGGARGRWRHKEINHANFMGCKNMPTDKV